MHGKPVAGYVQTVNILTAAKPEFTDTLNSICTVPTFNGEPWIPFPVRYRVQAVDKYSFCFI